MRRLNILLVCISVAVSALSQPLQHVTPEEVGLSSEALLRADAAVSSEIARGNIPGAVLAVVRNGRMAYLKAYGNKRVWPVSEPMTVNTVFDMASCSKAMSTALCAHVLAERGLIRLIDAVIVSIWEHAIRNLIE